MFGTTASCLGEASIWATVREKKEIWVACKKPPSHRSSRDLRLAALCLLCVLCALVSMAPKRGRPTASAKGKALMQQQLEQLPLIKKPLELIGEYINVPGTFWQGRMSAAEKETMYKCVVREHSALHKFTDGTMKEAFQLQEMGAMGTGSLEHGDASGEIFWMVHPFPVRVWRGPCAHMPDSCTLHCIAVHPCEYILGGRATLFIELSALYASLEKKHHTNTRVARPPAPRAIVPDVLL